jgi:ABC-type lipoprotein release transport system permease subunit
VYRSSSSIAGSTTRSPGAIAAAFAARFVQTHLLKTGRLDPGTFALVLAGVTITTEIAIWRPLRRATRTDPAIVLRNE